MNFKQDEKAYLQKLGTKLWNATKNYCKENNEDFNFYIETCLEEDFQKRLKKVEMEENKLIKALQAAADKVYANTEEATDDVQQTTIRGPKEKKISMVDRQHQKFLLVCSTWAPSQIKIGELLEWDSLELQQLELKAQETILDILKHSRNTPSTHELLQIQEKITKLTKAIEENIQKLTLLRKDASRKKSQEYRRKNFKKSKTSVLGRPKPQHHPSQLLTQLITASGYGIAHERRRVPTMITSLSLPKLLKNTTNPFLVKNCRCQD